MDPAFSIQGPNKKISNRKTDNNIYFPVMCQGMHCAPDDGKRDPGDFKASQAVDRAAGGDGKSSRMTFSI